MGKRLHTQATDEFGNIWVVEIHDSDFSGSSIEFDTSRPGISIDYQGQSQGVFNPIIPSRATVGLFVNSDDHQDFLDDLPEAVEGRFTLYVTKNANFHWAGVIITDAARVENMPRPFLFTINAIDGLGTLKTVDYIPTDGVNTAAWETFLQHVLNALTNIPTIDFWGPSDTFLTTSVNWYEQRMASGAGDEPLANARIHHRVFTKIGDDGEEKYTNTFDVLKEIAKNWNARIYLDSGTWRFEQYGQRRNLSGDFTEKQFDKTGGSLGFTNSANYDKTIDQTSQQAFLRGRHHEWFPAIRVARSTYIHESGANFMDGVQLDWTTEATEYNLGEFNYANGSAKLVFTTNIRYFADFALLPDDPAFVVHWKMKFKIGDKWLKREHVQQNQLPQTITLNPNPTYTPLTWEDSESYVHFFSYVNYPAQASTMVNLPAAFTTPFLPETGDLLVSFELVAVYSVWNEPANPNDPITGEDITNLADVSYWLDLLDLRITEAGEDFNDNERIYQVDNPVANGDQYTEIFNDTMIFGDGPKDTTFSRIQILDDSQGVWINSEFWDLGTVGGPWKLFQELRLWEIMTFRLNAIKRTYGQGYWDGLAKSRFNDGEFYYILGGGRVDAGQSQISGEWWAVRVYDEITNPIDPALEIIQFPVSPPVGPPTAPPTNFLAPISDAVTTVTIPAGPVSQIPISVAANGFSVQAGDTVTVVNPNSGFQMSIPITTDSVAGDTFISVSGDAGQSFPPGSPVIVTNNPTNQQTTNGVVNTLFEVEQTGADPSVCGDDCPAIGEVCSIYDKTTAGDGTTDGSGFILDQNGLRFYEPENTAPTIYLRSSDGFIVPTNKHPLEHFLAIGPSSNWAAGDLETVLFVVDDTFDQFKMDQIGLAVNTLGSGGGTSTVEIKRNAATVATIDLTGSTAKRDVYTFTEITLAENDVVTISIGSIQATPPTGLVVYLYIHE